MLNKLIGKKLLKKELTEKEQVLLPNILGVEQLDGINETSDNVACFRCGSRLTAGINQQIINHELSYYCSNCLVMGKVDARTILWHLPNEKVDKREVKCLWTGELTVFQKGVASNLIHHYQEHKHTLIHAVTGAGKTEMLYSLILHVLNEGGSVCIAAPRTDVCIELYKRVASLFTCEISLVYGGSEKPDFLAPLIICTTHQLLRYYQAFDCLILDEVDAFPFKGNPMLEYAVTQSIKPDGKKVLLTATPSKQQLKEVACNMLVKEELFIRFHGRPLPVPQFRYCPFKLERPHQKIPRVLKKLLDSQLSKKRKTLIFVPTIQTGKLLTHQLTQLYQDVSIENVSSEDEQRHEKVEKMRENVFQLFVTTTILERGMTFSDIDVIVFGAHHPIYNTASLVQIAGRVGRKNEFPNGSVYFFHEGQSLAMKECRQQIITMNRKGSLMQHELSNMS